MGGAAQGAAPKQWARARMSWPSSHSRVARVKEGMAGGEGIFPVLQAAISRCIPRKKGIR